MHTVVVGKIDEKVGEGVQSSTVLLWLLVAKVGETPFFGPLSALRCAACLYLQALVQALLAPFAQLVLFNKTPVLPLVGCVAGSTRFQW